MSCSCSGSLVVNATYINCLACAPGTYAQRPSTTSGAIGICADCPVSTFQSSAGQTSCNTVTTCLPGTAEGRAPTPTSDRACTPCVQGSSFTPEVGGVLVEW